MMSKSKFSSLLKGKSVPNLPSYCSPPTENDKRLKRAVEKQNIRKVQSLLGNASVIPTKLLPEGKSVFHIACEIGNEQIVNLILQKTNDVNDTTIQGRTALQSAAIAGHTYTVEKLLKASANVNQKDCDGNTALHHACYLGHSDCVRVLLSWKADPNVEEKSGKTPLCFAAHKGHVDICKWLLDRGANINCQDKMLVTPLMFATKSVHQKVCELLLKRGANPDLKDRDGRKAYDFAAAKGISELQDVFTRAASNMSDRGSVTASELSSHDPADGVTPSPVPSISSGGRVGVAANSDNESTLTDNQSSVSVDDTLLLSSHQHSPLQSRPNVPGRTEYALEELRRDHEQLNVEFRGISRENLKLKDKVEWLQSKLSERQGHENQENENTQLKTPVNEEEMRRLREERDMLRRRMNDLESQTFVKELASDSNLSNGENTERKVVVDSHQDSDEDRSGTSVKKTSLVNQGQANDLLDSAKKIPNGFLEACSERAREADGSQRDAKTLQYENAQLQAEVTKLKAETAKQQLSTSVDHEEVRIRNERLSEEVEVLRQEKQALEEELEIARSKEPTEAERLDAILAGSKNFEEDVNFDEEGFVEGRDMTKEEFLQAQNQQLKTHCSLLSNELEKLRATFDAILKAGDNLQADYDQLAAEKDSIQDELEVAVKEKTEVMNENEFLLADNNDLHENLKKIVHELEKMQEKYQGAESEIEELKRSVSVASKVGEVSRLLEERDALQQRCTDLETTSQRLQHDHNILLEEVQSLSESVTQLTHDRNQIAAERDQMAADLEEMEPVCQQHEALQMDYNQLEVDFAELLREKQALEQHLTNNNLVDGEGGGMMVETRRLQQELSELQSDNQRLEDVITGLSRHNVNLDSKVKDLEKSLVQAMAASQEERSQGSATESNSSGSSREEELRERQDEVISLKKQIAALTTEVEEWEKKHEDTVSTYRTHLLSAVQGHMDPDVKDALYHIIELRSMEQFC